MTDIKTDLTAFKTEVEIFPAQRREEVEKLEEVATLLAKVKFVTFVDKENQ
jgi:hypothetical protein